MSARRSRPMASGWRSPAAAARLRPNPASCPNTTSHAEPGSGRVARRHAALFCCLLSRAWAVAVAEAGAFDIVIANSCMAGFVFFLQPMRTFLMAHTSL